MDHPAAVLITGIFLLLAVGLYHFLQPPTGFPKDIPTIPFYVSLLGFFTTADQAEIYYRHLKAPLEAHGAVKIFFGSRWNILVQRPAMIQQMLKHEDTFAKSGNQKKIPYSVLAALTGDNIISAHGETWRLYQSVMRPGLLRPHFEVSGVVSNAERFVALLLDRQERVGPGKDVLVNPFIQRFAMTTLGECMLATNFRTLDSENAPMHAIHSEIKRQIFKPLFLNFPFLDKFPIPARVRARNQVWAFEDELVRSVRDPSCRTSNNTGSKDSLLSSMERALTSGDWTERQFRDNLKIVFIAGHENVQQLLNSLIYVLGKHQDVQDRVRKEVIGLDMPSSSNPGPYLTSVIYEVLRLFPPISQLINRKVSSTTILGGSVVIPKDTYVGWTSFGAQRDTATWGLTADSFVPERWGDKMDDIQRNYRRAVSKGAFIAFHGGNRACLGQAFALLEVRIVLSCLLRRCRWELDVGWEEKLSPAGLLAPRDLRVVFRDFQAE